METNHKLQEKPLPYPIPKVSAKKYAGLGDVVAAVAQPIARAIDAVVGTKVEKCGGCAKRKESLNKAFPLSGD
jgi:hypothetical protein